MTSPARTADELIARKCKPCEGGIPPTTPDEARRLLAELPGWSLSDDGRRIARVWNMKNFQAALDFFNAVGAAAEAEGHHPDLHLEQYRRVRIELWTHALGGLSENDFILAAKIDRLPARTAELRK